MSSDPTTPEARRPRGRSLAFRLNAWFVVVFVAGIAAISAAAIPAVRAAVDRSDSLVLKAQIERHAAVLATGLPRYRDAIEHSTALGNPDVPVRIRDERGTTLYEHGDIAASRVTIERVTGSLRLELGAPVTPWPTLLASLRPTLIGILLAAVLLAVLGGWALTWRGLRPVRELAETAREVIRSGDLSRRVPEHRNGDELATVSSLFNGVLERNQTLVRVMRESLDNVAHDLRTPLTRLRGTAEVALHTADLAAMRESLAVCIEESDHVLTMLRTLMDISQAETGTMKLARERVSLAALAAQVVELYAHVAEEAGISLSIDHEDDDVIVSADPVRMRQAIANLVDNAIKYTASGGVVTLGVYGRPGHAQLRVRDTGIGIDKDAVPRIWDRLFRAEPSRSKPGLGLGLSLVHAIVTSHGGTTSVTSTPGVGSTFELDLPRVPV